MPKISIDVELVNRLLWRLDNFGEQLIAEGKYHKKVARELKKKIRRVVKDASGCNPHSKF